MRDGHLKDLEAVGEPLVRMSDLAEYRHGLGRYQAGEWDDERWTAYRVRFGVYGQKQPGVQMVRIKIPGGVVPTAWLKTLATVNREFAQGDAHFTTRQDVQIYHVPLARSADLLETLYRDGITTREACGNTVRNVNACSLAGACPRELVDAGKVASQLATAWIRQPLVQHMPRKVKIGVSGCATDCGATAIHDLGFVAVEKDGRRGFRVLAGGGLGSQPVTAVEVLSFVAEDELSTAVETLARLHQRYSDRRNRNAARIKFVLKRFGAERFTALFQEEFARLTGLAQRPWQGLEWHTPAEAPVARTPVGVVASPDGSLGVVVYVPLGIVSSDQLEALHDIAVEAGVAELRTTRDQNIAFVGVAPARLARLVERVKAIGLDVPAGVDDVPDVVSCPGTTTCRIGITNAQTFGRQVEEEARGDASARGVSVHVSGCQNSCGLHHVADIGLHGMAKKIDGRSAPHYQIHIGGNAYAGEIAIEGPLVAARLANDAVRLLRQGYTYGKQPGESVRGWAERLGKDGIAGLLAPIEGRDADGLFVDWGDTAEFPGAPRTKGECAAPFAADDLLADLADDALISLDRALVAGRRAEAAAAADAAVVFAARRLLQVRQIPNNDNEPAAAVFAAVLAAWSDAPEVLSSLQAALAEGEPEDRREAVATFIDTAREAVERPAAPQSAAVGDLSALLAGVAE
ncbi:MAG: nitrite/sulfite reductase [Magnetospirillum sp.]|nr:nitrite/sulfite reductase [Magnetospirillum sp.]